MDKIESDLKRRYSVISNRISKIKTGIMQGYHILCTWTHTPTLDDSFVTGGLGAVQGSLGDWLFCIHMYNITLTNILHLYVCQYPMVLFPIDLIRKWGCKMPVGVFVDECSGAIIQQALGEKSTLKLRTVLFDDKEVSEKLEHVNQFGGLTDEAIWKTWEESQTKPPGSERPSDLLVLAAQQKVQIRSMGWAFDYIPKRRLAEELSDEEEKFFRRLYGE